MTLCSREKLGIAEPEKEGVEGVVRSERSVIFRYIMFHPIKRLKKYWTLRVIAVNLPTWKVWSFRREHRGGYRKDRAQICRGYKRQFSI